MTAGWLAVLAVWLVGVVAISYTITRYPMPSGWRARRRAARVPELPPARANYAHIHALEIELGIAPTDPDFYTVPDYGALYAEPTPGHFVPLSPKAGPGAIPGHYVQEGTYRRGGLYFPMFRRDT